MNSFTYVISSIDSNVAARANDCYIKLGGLPNNHKFLCEVIDFALNVNTIAEAGAIAPIVPVVEKYLSLSASTEMQILNGVQHPFKFDTICNIDRTTGLMTGYGHVFQVGNFNNHTVNFQIGLPNKTELQLASINQGTTTYWTLSLKMTPID